MIARPAHRRTLLPHALAVLYALAIVYASLQPFVPWMSPAGNTTFWLFAPWPLRYARFDGIANFAAYVPFGLFVALIPRRATFAMRTAAAVIAGTLLSGATETLQMYLPPRDASVVDLTANALGALAGGLGGALLARTASLREAITRQRAAWFLSGRLGDFGIALLALWLTAQLNPGIPLFAVNYEPLPSGMGAAVIAVDSVDSAATLVEAVESAFQLTGVGLFLTLLLRERRYLGAALLMLLGAALVAKGFAATFMLKPAVWDAWLRPGVSYGIAAGSLALLCAIFLPRPAAVATCAVALLSSVLLPLIASEAPSARAPLTLFNWRYGHLLNFNGLTHTVLLVWPLFVAAWLFALAGRPHWGEPERARSASPGGADTARL